MGKQWIVVADHALARVYEAGAGGELLQIKSLNNAAARGRAQELGSDRPGRRTDGFGHRHALGGEENMKSHAAAKFAHEIGQYLGGALRAHEFEALTLVMGPHFLGLLRKSLDADCARRVGRVIRKDYMHYGEPELRAHLAEAQETSS